MAVDQIVAALAQAADDEAEPETKSRLRAASDALGSIGYKVAVDVASKWAEHKLASEVPSPRRTRSRSIAWRNHGLVPEVSYGSSTVSWESQSSF